jgi:hypothetical protein
MQDTAQPFQVSPAEPGDYQCIYNFIWLYMLGDRLQDNAPKYNLVFKESGGTILLWYILGSFIIVGPFIALYIIIKNTNALAEEFNKKFSSPLA